MDRYIKTQKISIIGILGNLFLMGIKLGIGLITNSKAMLADAMNSASDIFSSLMSFIGNRISNKPKDENHNLGYGKAEYIYSIFIAISMIILSASLLKTFIKNIISKSEVVYSNWLIIICIITILTKLGLYLYTIKESKRCNNLLIKATALDHKNDCYLTFGNLVACIFSKYKIYFIDSIIGIGIACYMFITAFKIFKEAYLVLMDHSMDEKTKNMVLEVVKKYHEIDHIEHFNSTPVGYSYQINFTIYVDGALSTYESHNIANNLEKELIKLPNIYLVVIHVNPI